MSKIGIASCIKKVCKMKARLKKRRAFNLSLMWWGTPGNCSIPGEMLEHPGGIDRIKALEYLKVVKTFSSEKVKFS